jgi:hypothetical protein
MVWEGGVEVTIILMRVSEAGCVAAALKRGGAFLLGAVFVYDVLPIPSKFSFSGGVC